MNVSWKQSSAASRPTAATRKRHTSSRWASRKRWNGGWVTVIRRPGGAIREGPGASPLCFDRHPAQHRRGAVALLAELHAQRVEHGQDVRRADRLEPRERPARVVEAEHHAVVDVLRRADVLGHREARLVDELADD